MFERGISRSRVAIGILTAASFMTGSDNVSRGQSTAAPSDAGAVAKSTVEKSSSPDQISPDTVLKPRGLPARLTPPIKRVRGETTEEIIASLQREDPDPLLAKYLSALHQSVGNPKALALVLAHIRDLSEVLDGHPVKYDHKPGSQALAGEPSAYRVLLVKLMSLAHFFPKDLEIKGPESLLGRNVSAELLEALQSTLEANVGLARHIIADPDGSIHANSLSLLPHYLIFSDGNFKIDATRLVGGVKFGYFDQLLPFFDCLPRIPSEFIKPIIALHDAAIFLRGEDTRDALRILAPYINDAQRFHDISPSLGEAYLTCLTSLRVRDLGELDSQASLLRSYIDGLLRNGDPNPAAGVFSITALRGVLLLDTRLVQNLILLHKYTGFKQIERFHDHTLDIPEVQHSGGALRAYVNEVAALIRDPKFREDSKIAAVVFAGTENNFDSGPFLSYLETQGYVLLPFEAYTDSDLAQACESTTRIVGKPADLVLVIGDGYSTEDNSVTDRLPTPAIPGNPLGITDRRSWFEPLNQPLVQIYLEARRDMLRPEPSDTRELAPWVTRNTLNRIITVGKATLDTSDTSIFDRLAKASAPVTQFVFLGSKTAPGDDNPARRVHIATGCDVFGSGNFMTGVHITFDENQRVSQVLFSRRDAATEQGQEGSKDAPASPPRLIESIWYPARK